MTGRRDRARSDAGPLPPDLDQAAALLGTRVRRDVPLGPLTTYRVGGPARLCFRAETEADLEVVRTAVVATGLPVLVIGNGSNLLVADAGFAGLAVTLGDGFAAIELGPEGRVRAGAAVALPVLARRTAAAGLTGLEWAVGVPGSVGGAVRMNAGGHGSDVAAVIQSARLVDLSDPDPAGAGRDWSKAELALGYRSSAVTPSRVVVHADFLLAPGDRARAEAEIAEIVRWRRANQPGGQNAGSVFTNPPGDSAGRLIDQAGLRGYRRGSAHVSEKHANFIQADADGSADDVWELMLEVQELVEQRQGVRLRPEVRLVGFDAPRYRADGQQGSTSGGRSESEKS